MSYPTLILWLLVLATGVMALFNSRNAVHVLIAMFFVNFSAAVLILGAFGYVL